ncbi:hypothetical protein LR48_Vigan2358s000100 [Vigna angularis]|nr:hypothetical protein LR48_Vigan2358s000100 [Vigna angularis]
MEGPHLLSYVQGNEHLAKKVFKATGIEEKTRSLGGQTKAELKEVGQRISYKREAAEADQEGGVV